MNLTVNFTPTGPLPQNGWRLSYRPLGSNLPYTVYPVNFFTSPAVVPGVVAQDYEGILQGDKGGGQFCAPVAFQSNSCQCPPLIHFELVPGATTVDIINLQFSVLAATNQTVRVILRDMVMSADVGSIDITVTPAGTIVSPTPVQFTALTAGRLYKATLFNICNPSAFVYQTVVTSASGSVTWVADLTECEQDDIIAQVHAYDKFSSPGLLYYDNPTGRMYVGDHDNGVANCYWFNPQTIIDHNSVTYINGLQDVIYRMAADKLYRRMYFTGLTTGGLKVLDVATGAFSLIPYGSDNTDFSRDHLSVCTDNIYVRDDDSMAFTIIKRDTLAILTPSLLASAVPNGATYLFGKPLFFQVGSELWVVQRRGTTPNIGRYNLMLTSFLGSIPLSACALEAGSSQYVQTGYHDVANGKFYVSDAGSSKLFVIDTTTRNVVHSDTISNREGKAMAVRTFLDDTLTGDLYMCVVLYNNASDTTVKKRTYVMSRTTLGKIMNLLYDRVYRQLEHQQGTPYMWSAEPGEINYVNFVPALNWDSDGFIYKHIR